jgi:hypothetical protein
VSRTKSKTAAGYVKRNALAGIAFASFGQSEAHPVHAVRRNRLGVASRP